MKLTECAVRGVIYGTSVRITKPVNVYECELRDNMFVGPPVEIQKGCATGSRNRIQLHMFICENAALEKDYFTGHNVTFVSDLFCSGASDPSPDNWVSITLGDLVAAGSEAIILSPYIYSGAAIGTGLVVVRPIENRGIYAESPTRLLRILRNRYPPA